MVQRRSNEDDCSWEGAVRSMSDVVLHRIKPSALYGFIEKESGLIVAPLTYMTYSIDACMMQLSLSLRSCNRTHSTEAS